MQEILSTRAWAIESKYFNVNKQLLIQMLQSGTVDASFLEKKIAERPTMHFASVGPGAVLSFLEYINPDAAKGDNAKANAAAASGLSGTNPNPDEKIVAIVPLNGPMMKYGGMCSYGTKDVVRWMKSALADPNVCAIVMVTDSPGGSVDGTEELGTLVKNASKPVVTYIDGMAASAAYWVSSQSSYIFINSKTTAWVGSIGTLIMHVDKSAWLQKEGYDVTYITADRSTNKVLGNSTEPLSEDAVAMFKADLNTINDTFIAAVESGRSGKLSEDQDKFTAKVYNGQDGISQGLVDAVGTLDDAILKAVELAEAPNKKTSKTNKSNQNSNSMFSIKSFPKLHAALVSAGIIASTDVEGPSAEDTVKHAEAAISAAEERVAAADQKLAEANTAKTNLQSSLNDLTEKLKASEEKASTLQAWKDQAAGVTAPKEDESNKGATAPKAAYEMVIEQEIEKAKKRK